MFLSMTGFGRKSYEFPWGTVVVEISSINHKFQDFSVKLPQELISLENRILNLMRSLITRGKVRMSASITWNPGAQIPVINDDGLMNFYNQIKKTAEKNGLEFSANLTDILMIPGLIGEDSNAAAQAALENPEAWDGITKDAVEALMEMKRSEGEKLKIKISEDLSSLEKFLAQMEERWKVSRDAALDSIKSRIQEVLEHYNLEIDEARIAAEVALAADKWDVSEEIARMEAHTGKFHQVMDSDEVSGKKIDFLIQEMNREVNTMGSKVNDAEFRWLVVEAKTCIERMREQIQNVE